MNNEHDTQDEQHKDYVGAVMQRLEHDAKSLPDLFDSLTLRAIQAERAVVMLALQLEGKGIAPCHGGNCPLPQAQHDLEGACFVPFAKCWICLAFQPAKQTTVH